MEIPEDRDEHDLRLLTCCIYLEKNENASVK